MKPFILVIILTFCFSCTDLEKKPKVVDYFVDIEIAENTSSRPMILKYLIQYSQNIQYIDSSNKIDHVIQACFLLDSLKKTKTYPLYLNKLDIGMIADAGAYMVKTIEKNENEKYVFWKTQYKTHDACPFAYGTNVFLSYFKNDNLVNTYEVAHKKFMGDPPISKIISLNAQVKNDSILIAGYELINEESKKDSTRFKSIIIIK